MAKQGLKEITKKGKDEVKPTDVSRLNPLFLPREILREQRTALYQKKLRDEQEERTRRQTEISSVSTKRISPIFQVSACRTKDLKPKEAIETQSTGAGEWFLQEFPQTSHFNAAGLLPVGEEKGSLWPCQDYRISEGEILESLPDDDDRSFSISWASMHKQDLSLDVPISIDLTKELRYDLPWCLEHRRLRLESERSTANLVRQFLTGRRTMTHPVPSLSKFLASYDCFGEEDWFCSKLIAASTVAKRPLSEFSPSQVNGTQTADVDALMLVGHIGAGKTSLISEAADLVGIRVLEENSTLKRTGKLICERVLEAVQSKAVEFCNIEVVGTISEKVSTRSGTSTSTRSRKRKFNSVEKRQINYGHDDDSDFVEPPETGKRRGTGTRSQFDSEESVKGFIDRHENAGNCSASCLVLEDVDCIYKDEAGFWQGLKKIVLKSKRPIVIVANQVPEEVKNGSVGQGAQFELVPVGDRQTVYLEPYKLTESDDCFESIKGVRTSTSMIGIVELQGLSNAEKIHILLSTAAEKGISLQMLDASAALVLVRGDVRRALAEMFLRKSSLCGGHFDLSRAILGLAESNDDHFLYCLSSWYIDGRLEEDQDLPSFFCMCKHDFSWVYKCYKAGLESVSLVLLSNLILCTGIESKRASRARLTFETLSTAEFSTEANLESEYKLKDFEEKLFSSRLSLLLSDIDKVKASKALRKREKKSAISTLGDIDVSPGDPSSRVLAGSSCIHTSSDAGKSGLDEELDDLESFSDEEEYSASRRDVTLGIGCSKANSMVSPLGEKCIANSSREETTLLLRPPYDCKKSAESLEDSKLMEKICASTSDLSFLDCIGASVIGRDSPASVDHFEDMKDTFFRSSLDSIVECFEDVCMKNLHATDEEWELAREIGLQNKHSFEGGIKKRQVCWSLGSSLLSCSSKADGVGFVEDVDYYIQSIMRSNSEKRTRKRVHKHTFARHISMSTLTEAEAFLIHIKQ